MDQAPLVYIADQGSLVVLGLVLGMHPPTGVSLQGR